MQKLTTSQIISNIENGKCFEAVVEDYSFTLKIEHYCHYICGAVHDGHQFRKELWDKCLHTEYERWYEEDPATKQMVQSHPIVLAGCDSRFEYDLNRSPDNAIYTDAWGKQLWKIPLSKDEHKRSLAKHNNFYKVVTALVAKIESIHKICVVYDMHSYNRLRWTRKVPVWNLGTANIDNNRFGKTVAAWSELLAQTPFNKEIEATSKINDTFTGNGYFLKFITQNFNNTLVLATEIAKVYCDEMRQIVFPEIVHLVEIHLQWAVKQHAELFLKTHRP